MISLSNVVNGFLTRLNDGSLHHSRVPAAWLGHFPLGSESGAGAGRSDEVLVPRARQSCPDQTGDLAAQTLISDQGPSVGALGFCALDFFKENPLGLGAIRGS